MAPLGQGQNWSEVLCCPVCNELYGLTKVPINLACGHPICSSCILKRYEVCPHDGSQIPHDAITYPVNRALLSILNIHHEDLLCTPPTPNYIDLTKLTPLTTANNYLLSLAQYLRMADSERGGAVYSNLISRTTQRRLLAILFSPIYFPDGRISAMRAIRSLCDRIVTELSCLFQNTVHISAFLWSAVRSRGCQFLGPAMQEDVLRLILLTLANGELIARKTLVMYVVQTLSEDYPHVSKTCVGHVVQLLYRASCFNVIKRDGESSLMQLKKEFRDYESLRREHDSQIVQIALEAGLRISPDQWSALLYGDPHHRSHMQSIVDRLHTPQLLSNAVKELQSLAERNIHPISFQKLVENLVIIAKIDHNADAQWHRLNETLASLEILMHEYVSFTKRHMNMNDYRKKVGIGARTAKQNEAQPQGFQNNGLLFCRYKTKMCRDVVAGRQCPRHAACTYAHMVEELRSVDNSNSRTNGILRTENNRMLQNSNNNNIQLIHHPGMMLLDHAPLNIPQVVDMMPIPIMPVHAIGDNIMDNHTLVIDNGDSRIVNVVPLVTHTSIPDPEVYSKQAATAVPTPVGMPSPVFIMPSHEQVPAPIPLPNAHLPVMQPNNASVPGAAEMYSYQIQPTPSPLMTPSSTVVFTQDKMWRPGQAYQKSSEVPVFFDIGRQSMPSNIIASDASRSSTNESASRSLNEQNSKWHTREGSLIIRRNEVIQRLRSFQASKDESESEDAERSDHVSFTVANSVLFDDVESLNVSALDFPPIPLPTLATIQSTVPQNIINDALNAVTSTSWSLVDSKNTKNTLTMRTICPTTLMCVDSSKPATVQADCTIMNVRDAIEQPLVAVTLQLNNFAPQASYEMVGPVQLTDLLPQVMKSVAPPLNLQDFVSDSLDKIITVEKRINEVPSSTSSAVEKEQLKVELNIANRQLSALDLQTKQTCLLDELKAIDECIENLSANPDS